jgi:hypothetical protein
MKIPERIGIEDVRSVPVSVLAGTGTGEASFAESLEKNVTADSERPAQSKKDEPAIPEIRPGALMQLHAKTFAGGKPKQGIAEAKAGSVRLLSASPTGSATKGMTLRFPRLEISRLKRKQNRKQYRPNSLLFFRRGGKRSLLEHRVLERRPLLLPEVRMLRRRMHLRFTMPKERPCPKR